MNDIYATKLSREFIDQRRSQMQQIAQEVRDLTTYTPPPHRQFERSYVTAEEAVGTLGLLENHRRMATEMVESVVSGKSIMDVAKEARSAGFPKHALAEMIRRATRMRHEAVNQNRGIVAKSEDESDLFKANKRQRKKAAAKRSEGRKAKTAPKPAAGQSSGQQGGSKPPAGFSPIPKSKKGGYRKMQGTSYVYWYPGQGVSGNPHDDDHGDVHSGHAKHLKEKLAETQAKLKPSPEVHSKFMEIEAKAREAGVRITGHPNGKHTLEDMERFEKRIDRKLAKIKKQKEQQAQQAQSEISDKPPQEEAKQYAAELAEAKKIISDLEGMLGGTHKALSMQSEEVEKQVKKTSKKKKEELTPQDVAVLRESIKALRHMLFGTLLGLMAGGGTGAVAGLAAGSGRALGEMKQIQGLHKELLKQEKDKEGSPSKEEAKVQTEMKKEVRDKEAAGGEASQVEQAQKKVSENKNEKTVREKSGRKQDSKEKATIEKPKAEKPKAEKPKAEKPKAEKPKAKASVSKEHQYLLDKIKERGGYSAKSNPAKEGSKIKELLDAGLIHKVGGKWRVKTNQKAAAKRRQQKASRKRNRVKKGIYLDLSSDSLVIVKKSGPFIGPRGGKWADAKHTIPWKKEEAKPKRKPPGSQLPKKTLEKLQAFGVKKLPEAAIPVKDIVVDFTNPDTTAMIKWRDKAGRIQSGYTPEFHKANAEKKWQRIADFREKAPEIIKGLQKGLKGSDPKSPQHQAFLIANIVALTGLRPGSSKSLEGRFGVSTLRPEHVKINGSRVDFEFVGKQGKVNKATIRNKAVADALSHYAAGDSESSMFSGNALTKARSLLPQGMKLKDFRTIKATNTAFEVLDAVVVPPPLTGDKTKDKKLLAKALLEASKQVAKVINNTPSVARASYVHPEVFRQWAIDRVGADPKLFEEV